MTESLNLDYKKVILPNGIKCILYQRNEIHSITISVEVQTGSLDEDRSTSGLSHVLEHVTFDGTRDFTTWEDLDRFRNSISGSSNASTSYEDTTYYGAFPSKYYDEALYYLSQIVLHPTLTDESVDKERTIILDEKKRYDDSVDHQVFRNVIENRFSEKENSFVYEIIGFEDNLKNFKAKDVQDYHKKHYIPENLEIYIVGNFEIEDIEKSLNKYFVEGIENNNKKPIREFKSKYPNYSGVSLNSKQKLDLDQYYLTITFPGLDFATTGTMKRLLMDYVEDVLASSQYMQSVLWKRLREELGLVYGVSAWTESFYNRAFTTIQTSFNPEYLEIILKEIYKGINSVKNGKASDEVFNLRKKKIEDTQPMRLDNPGNALNWINFIEDEKEQHNFDLNMDKFLEISNNFKFEEAVKLTDEIMDWDKVNIGIVSSDDTEEVNKNLKIIWEKITNEGKE